MDQNNCILAQIKLYFSRVRVWGPCTILESRPKPCPFLEPSAPISTLTRLFISYNKHKIMLFDKNTFDSHALSIMEKSMHVWIGFTVGQSPEIQCHAKNVCVRMNSS